jgi:hypothetical protein
MGSYLLNSCAAGHLRFKDPSNGAGRHSCFRILALTKTPAAIEPATPSLPSMRGGFTPPCSASRPHTYAQVEALWGVVSWGGARLRVAQFLANLWQRPLPSTAQHMKKFSPVYSTNPQQPVQTVCWWT